MGVVVIADPKCMSATVSLNSRPWIGNSKASGQPPLISGTSIRSLLQLEQKPGDVQLTAESGRSSRNGTVQKSDQKAPRKKRTVSSKGSEVDYGEAAVALEQIYTGRPPLSPAVLASNDSDFEAVKAEVHPRNVEAWKADGDADSADLSPPVEGRLDLATSTAGDRCRRRKDLKMRVSLRSKKSDKSGIESQYHATDLRREPPDLCSASVSQLVRQYGGTSANITAQNWNKLSRRELLSAEEERWLASIMKPFKALQRLKVRMQQQLLREPTDDQFARAAKMDLRTLRRHITVGEAARNKLVQLNLRLVLYLARRYQWERSSLSISDLCQEGVKGLITAVERFEPNKGFRFSTYAIFWIRNSMLRAQTRSGHPVRSPFNVAELKLNIKRMTLELLWELGRAPAAEEVMERVGIDKERYMTVMRSSQKLMSLHARDRVTGSEMIHNLEDPQQLHDESLHFPGLLLGGTHAAIADMMLRLGLDDVLDSLKPKESLVLRQRFGLDGKGERSLGEVGRNLRMSREMARKHEARGLLKLKHPTRLAYLRSYLCSPSPLSPIPI